MWRHVLWRKQERYLRQHLLREDEIGSRRSAYDPVIFFTLIVRPSDRLLAG